MNTLTRHTLAHLPVFSGLWNLPRALDGLFDSSLAELNDAARYFESWNPAVDVFETANELLVKAELPGFKKEDISVEIENDQLTLSGERKNAAQAEEKAYRTERFIGKFERVVTLPAQVKADSISAQYQDGMLTVTLPKADSAKRRQVEVKIN